MTVHRRQINTKAIGRSITLLCLCLLLVRCANESVPQGGKKDETPPKARKMNPANQSTQFNSDKIEITFNEYIKSGGFSQTLISPPLDKNPDYKVSGKTLKVKIKSPLRPNTTYTINFADDIKDVNEGNAAPNFTYVFSTGAFIDSQELSGKVILAKDNSPADGVIVALYPADISDGILSTKPYYFAKTNKGGEYQIKNIRQGDYHIYALKDQNFNYLYDQPNELIGFSDSIVSLNDTIKKKAELVAFEATNKKLQLIRARSVAPGWVQFAYSNPLSKFSLQSDIQNKDDFWYFSKDKDTINYWLADYYTNKATFYAVANDTLRDTARIELKIIPKDSMLSNNNNALSLTNQAVTANAFEKANENLNAQSLFQPLKINLSRPVLKINASKSLQISEDSTKKMYSPGFRLDEASKMFFTADFEKKEKTDYTLLIPDSMFQDLYGTWNRETPYRFRTNTKTDYGNIHLSLHASHVGEQYVFRLLNSEDEPVKEISFNGEAEKKIELPNIPAGNYKAVVIEDRNGNGTWDTGDFKNKRQPEKIYTFSNTYQLKGGWDLDVEVKF